MARLVGTPAQRAADLLPTPETDYTAARKVSLIWAALGCAAFAVLMSQAAALALVSDEWWILALGLLIFLVLKFVNSRRRGGESGTVAIDQAGTIWVISGRRSIRRLQRLFEDGAIEAYRTSSCLMWGFYAFVFLALGMLLLLSFEEEDQGLLAPLFVVFTILALAALNLMRNMWREILVCRRDNLRLLESHEMLPRLALYARYHGEEAALSGVPADRLAATLDEHPDEYKIVVDWREGGIFGE